MAQARSGISAILLPVALVQRPLNLYRYPCPYRIYFNAAIGVGAGRGAGRSTFCQQTTRQDTFKTSSKHAKKQFATQRYGVFSSVSIGIFFNESMLSVSRFRHGSLLRNVVYFLGSDGTAGISNASTGVAAASFFCVCVLLAALRPQARQPLS